MSEPALVFEGVSRSFGTTMALDALNLQVPQGTVLGLVGRNGAGKTTALRLALGTLFPDSGRMRVLGLDPVAEGLAVRTKVSLLSEEAHVYPWMTVGEVLDFGQALRAGWDVDLAKSLGARLDLDRRQRVSALSRGTRAKVALVLAAASRPQVLLLDDPTAGLDPLVRREVLQGVLEAVPAEGGAVIYASHLIQDVERVADRVAFLDGGCLKLEGALETLKSETRRVTAVYEDRAPDPRELHGVLDAVREGRVLSIVARGDTQAIAARARALGAREVEVEALSLEEILVACLRGPAAREVEDV